MNLLFSTVVLAVGVTTSSIVNANCYGKLYGINGGRGDVGIVFSLDETTKQADIHSQALYSSAAMAYVEGTNRLYYVSAPRPTEYQLDPSALNLTPEQLASLPIKGKKFKYSRLAYLDLNTNEHVQISRTKNMYRLAYDSTTNKLFGSSSNKLYEINLETHTTTLLGTMSGYTQSSEIWRGDMVFDQGQPYIITSSSVFELDISTLGLTKRSDHNLTQVTGATLDQHGKLIVSREKINDLGHINSSELYHVDIDRGNTCLIGEFPVRLNDLAIDTSALTTCSVDSQCVNRPSSDFVIANIDNARETQADDGYALNGHRMVGALNKLNNSDLFGAGGVANKLVQVKTDFSAYDSLSETRLTQMQADVLFVGGFKSAFSPAEVAQAHSWSSKPGNVTIIGGGANVQTLSLFAQWGYAITASTSNPNVVVNVLDSAVKSTIIDGPFGRVTQFNQGGSAQGYFSSMPSSSEVIAVNQQGKPVIVYDTATQDILLSDIDILTNLGQVTSGNTVISDADKLLMNLFNFASNH